MCSFATGIEFRENSLSITSKTTAYARKSQVFNLCIGLSGLVNDKADNKESKQYALFIGDTVVVNEVTSALIYDHFFWACLQQKSFMDDSPFD